MAEVLASLKKIGGNGEQYTETVLWTNPSPTASFAGQTVTLSDSIANYKYLKVKACYNGGYTNVAVSPLILVSEFMTIVPSTRRCTFNIGNSSAGNSYYSRAVQYVSPTSISFTDDWALKSNNTANTDVIPLEILGINELAHGEGVLATPFQLTLKSTVANGRSVIDFDKSTFPYTKFRVISKVNNLRYIGNGSWVTLAVGDIVDFSALPDTSLTIDVSGSTTSTQSSIEFYK